MTLPLHQSRSARSRKSAAKAAAGERAARSRWFRPALQRLEDRTVPSTFEMRITTASGFNLTIADGDANDANANPGVISYIGPAGNFALNIDVGDSKPASGSAASPDMALSFNATKFAGSAADAVTVEISDQGFTTSPLAMTAQVGGTLSGSVSQVTSQAFFDNGNASFGTGGGSSALETFTTGSFNATDPLAVGGATPYSLTERVVVSGGVGGGISTGSFELSSPPPSDQITTMQTPATAAVNSPISDTATVSGLVSPTGTVTFALYDNSTAGGTPLYTSPAEPLTATGTPGVYTADSPPTTVGSAGTVYWVASFSGDGSDNPVTSGAADEPVQITQPQIDIVKLTNGTNNDSPPVAGVPDGPTVPVGSTVTWTYNVTNPGDEPIANVNVTDNIAGVNPTPVVSGGFNVGDTNHDGLLEPGETWVFTASGTATAGQYSNVGTVTGTSTITNTPVTATNPDHYYGTLSLGDFVWNDVNANGIQDSNDLTSNGINGVLVDLKNSGGTVIATTTTGNNPVGGAPGYYQFSGLLQGSYTVVIDSSNFNAGGPLAGDTPTPSMVAGSTPANDSNGSPAPVTLTTANDETIDFGYFQAAINIVKLTNGTNNDSPPVAGTPDGPTVPVGSTVTWTYDVTNPTGVALSGVSVTDDIAGVNPTPVLSGGFNVGDTNHDGLLENGETWVFTASGVAIAGQYSNIGTATGTPVTPTGGTIPGATPVTATNPDHYYGTLSLGDFVWNDVNANGIQDSNDLTSNGINGVLVDLKNSGGTVIATTTTGNNPVGGAPGYYQFSGLLQGSYTVVIDSSNFNAGGPLAGDTPTPSMVAGSTPANDSNGSPAPVTLTTANDETIDFGYFQAAINIVKLTNGTNNDSPPVAGVPDGPTVPVGSTVTWTYDVTNPTGVALSGVSVTDNIAGVNPTPVLSSGFNVGDTNHDGLLENGETWVFTASGVAIAGQYSNIGTATGTPVTPTGGTIPGATPVVATNPDHYYGTLSLGDFVWNDVNANGIQDSNDLTSNGINGVLVDLKNSGGTVIATTTTGNNPVGGAPGYYQFSGLLQGSYTVVIDSSNFNAGGPLAGFSPTPSMVAGSTPANDSNGSPAPVTLTTANDETIDFGYFQAAINIVKLTNGTNNDSPPVAGVPDGPTVPVGSTVTWTYDVTNPTGVALSGVSVTDNIAGVNPTPVLSSGFNVGDTNHDGLLENGETWVFTASGTATAGQYSNIGTAIGTPVTPTGGTIPGATPVTATNPDHYFGYTTNISILKLTNGTNNDNPPVAGTPDGPLVPVGNTVTWTYNVTTTGNVPLSGVTVTDNIAGVNPTPVLSGGFNTGDTNHDGLLESGETWHFTANGTAVVGQYSNIGTTTGTPVTPSGGSIPGAATQTASNPDHYYGYLPLTINTTQQPATATVGSTIADMATISGGVFPAGTVTFKLYGNSTATGSPLYTSLAVTLVGGVATSPGYTATAAGTDYWVATYNGDGNNSPVTSGTALEPVSITKSGPGITTTPGMTAPTTGGGVCAGEFATIGFWHNQNGQAVINSFNGGPNSTQLGNWLATNFPNLFGQANPYTSASLASFGKTGLAGLTNAQVAAVYAGLWTPSGLTKNTYVQSFAVALGIYASTSSLGGASLVSNGLAATYGFVVSGTGGAGATWVIGSDSPAFGGQTGSLTVFQSLQTVGSNFTPATGVFFGGDQSKTSATNDVTNGINSVGDIPGGSFSLTCGCGSGGGTGNGTGKLTDSATISGGYNPTGSVTFYLFAPGVTPNSNNSNAVYTDTVTINGDGNYSTASGTNPGGYLPTATGTYNWVAVYGGDTNNMSVTSPYGSEPWSVGAANPSINTIDGGTVMVGSGTKLTDSAMLAGAVSPTGTVTFYLFAPGVSPNATKSNNVYTDAVAVTANGTYTTATGTNPGGYLPSTAGIYQWVAVFSGDGKNASVSSSFGDEPETAAAGGSISGTKFLDLTGNGFSADDTPLAGVTIQLYKDVNGDGMLDAADGNPVATAVTSSIAGQVGTYSFNSLAPGKYFVQEAVPAGYVMTGPALGTYYTVTVSAGSSTTGQNFDDFPTDQCAATNISYKVLHNGVTTTVSDLRGNTHQGDTVTVSFGLPAHTTDQVSLVSYTAPGSTFDANTASQQVIYQVASNTFTTGATSQTFSLTLMIPNCYYQVDFVCGPAIDHFGPAGSNIFYTAENRLFSADNGGTCATMPVRAGDFATIGFWHNNNGQALIKGLNGSSSSTALAAWLASNFPNLYGANGGATKLVNSNGTPFTNTQVAAAFLSSTFFGCTGQKTNAQILSAALATYVTSTNLAGGNSAAGYGFNTSAGGTGMDSYNVGSNGSAIGVANNSTPTVMQLLQAVNAAAANGLTSAEANAANTIFSNINQGGDINLTAPSDTGLAYNPDQVRTAYGVNSLTLDGTGQTIAIVDAYDNPAIVQSLDAFDAQFGLADGGRSLYDLYGPASTFLTIVNQDGSTDALPATDPSGAGTNNWEGEESLDVEWVHAMAPGAQIVLVEANSPTLPDLMTGVATAASMPGVSVVSMSWGFREGLAATQDDEALYDSYLTTPAGHQGVTFVASTGDFGTADPEYPAFSPNVLAVGGTSLYLNNDNSYASETGWGYATAGGSGTFIGSGGGVSQFEAEPAFQQGVQASGNRTTPDVSFLADPATGAWISDSYNLGSDNPWEIAGGTSLSAPSWAALVALTNQARVKNGGSTLGSTAATSAQQAVYNISPSAFSDVTTGTNGAFTAGSGYDVVTGLGSPVANVLVPALANYAGAVNTPATPPTYLAGYVPTAPTGSTGSSGGQANFSVFSLETVSPLAASSARSARPAMTDQPMPLTSAFHASANLSAALDRSATVDIRLTPPAINVGSGSDGWAAQETAHAVWVGPADTAASRVGPAAIQAVDWNVPTGGSGESGAATPSIDDPMAAWWQYGFATDDADAVLAGDDAE